ncbi:MAG: CYTH domain-containing protein [Dysgonamonadaceae bacterium]
MGYEIERKFLVSGEYKNNAYQHYRIKQGYLSQSNLNVVRVRILDQNAFLTIKSSTVQGTFTHLEYEYEIPVVDAEQLLKLCESNIIDKTRYLIKSGDHIFEVDEFYGDNNGLVMAEIELRSEDEKFDKPNWIGLEVTGDERYYNAYLSMHPFKEWNKSRQMK